MVMHFDPRMGIAFRLPNDDDPSEFEWHLRKAGLNVGQLEVWPREAGPWWNRFLDTDDR